MEIRTRIKCTECENGYLPNSIWDEYNKWELSIMAQTGEIPSAQQDYQWWLEQGYLTPPDSKLHECWECQGTTWVKKWMSLDEFKTLPRGGR